jgi:hypothetical protein
MSAVNDASIRKYNQTPKVVHIPIWAFQGGTDTAPSPTYTNKLVSDYNNAGAVMRYTLYDGVGHTCWYKAFAEADFYPWMLKQSKINIHVAKGITAIKGTAYPKLILAEGFFAYQWEKDGVIISGATTNTYIAKAPGKYRARFSRVAAPTAAQWNKWSPIVTITSGTATARLATEEDTLVVSDEGQEDFKLSTFPNPASPERFTVTLDTKNRDIPVQLRVIDQMGKSLYQREHTAREMYEGVNLSFASMPANGIFVVIASQGSRTVRRKIAVKR